MAYRRFHVSQRQDRPDQILREVEIDHALIDMLGIHPVTGQPLGRPWLTALLDRASSMVLGCHIGYAPPSYAAVQRCLSHSFWPKDLSGYDLEHPWPCEGVPYEVYTDQGKDFRSRSLQRSERAMSFVLRPLPGRMPQLKGKIERFFGRFNIEVYGHKQGKTFSSSKARGDYKSAMHAEWEMSRIRDDVLRYLVDEYHVGEHRGLNHARPLDVWQESFERYGVRHVKSYDQIIELTGQVIERPLGNAGIEINGINYHSPEMTELNESLGRGSKWVECRFDPYDLREIFVLDKANGKHIRADATNPAISRGVSYRNSKLHVRNAKLLGTGKHVTEADIERAKLQAEQDAVKRMGGTRRGVVVNKAVTVYSAPGGEYFTPMGGAGASGSNAAADGCGAAPAGDAPAENPSPTVPERAVNDQPRTAADAHRDLRDRANARAASWGE